MTGVDLRDQGGNHDSERVRANRGATRKFGTRSGYRTFVTYCSTGVLGSA